MMGMFLKGGIAQLARASALQAEGRRFDSDYLHKRKKTSDWMSLFFCGDAPRRGALSMPRGSAPIIPCGSAFRICLWQIHGSRRRAGARMDIQTDVFFCFVEMHRCFASLPYLSLGALPLLYPAAPPSFSPPANDAIPLRLALLNACLAPCAGRAESVYHIIDGTGKETVRN